MKRPAEVRAQLQARWDRDLAAWAHAHVGVVSSTTTWPVSVPLGAPTQDVALADVSATKEWVRAWSGWSDGGTVRTAPRTWPHLGRQTIPTHLDLADPADVAR